MKIFLATWTEDNQGQTLTKAEAFNRLLSYYFLQQLEKKDEFIETYVLNGRTPCDLIRLNKSNKR